MRQAKTNGGSHHDIGLAAQVNRIANALRGADAVCQRGALSLCVVLLGVVFAGQITIVLLRYVMGIGFLELQDLVTYAFSATVALSVCVAYGRGRHVRVDVLRCRLGQRGTRLIDRVGALTLVLPTFGILVFNAWPLVASSFMTLEGSRETGGLGGLFLVKGTVIAMCALVILTAVVSILKPESGDGK